jgi:hypothetical protein
MLRVMALMHITRPKGGPTSFRCVRNDVPHFPAAAVASATSNNESN